MLNAQDFLSTFQKASALANRGGSAWFIQQFRAAGRPVGLSQILTILLLATGGCRPEQATRPAFKLDLQSFGYRYSDDSRIGDYTELSFLSDDLLVVSVNQRTFSESPTLLNSDSPTSTILVLDFKTARVVTNVQMPVEKRRGSVQSVSGQRLAVLNEAGLQICTRDLRCRPPMAGPGPVFVSPKGRRIVFGGNGMTPRRVLDVEPFKQLTSFEDASQFAYGGVIPGERALLVSHGHSSFAIRQPGKDDRLIAFSRGGDFDESRFLNDETIVYLDHGSNEAVVADLDNRQLHRSKLEKAYRTSFLPTAAGKRFGIYEHGYTTWNAVVNFLDIEDSRPQNFQRVRVIDLFSGNEVARLEWDPVKTLIKPQLSPDGHWLAKVEAGALEVVPIK